MLLTLHFLLSKPFWSSICILSYWNPVFYFSWPRVLVIWPNTATLSLSACPLMSWNPLLAPSPMVFPTQLGESAHSSSALHPVSVQNIMIWCFFKLLFVTDTFLCVLFVFSLYCCLSSLWLGKCWKCTPFKEEPQGFWKWRLEGEI